ncbi:MAG: aminodeoxychorismate synthase component I [Proteobacteria bacterium]|nr:aminodeoxychorismate synthase component I [Pseudomonadota bacterium]
MNRQPFVLIDDSLSPGGSAWLFENPVEIIACDDPAGVNEALDRIAGAGSRGLYAAGFMAYELGYLLETRLAPLMPAERRQPLIWMGLFGEPLRLDRDGIMRFLDAQAGNNSHAVEGRGQTVEREQYLDVIGRVKDYIAAGDVYQINFTFHHRFRLTGDPASLYRDLRRRQPVAHGALLQGPDWHLLSLSPELFVEINGGHAVTRPMKGTAQRGATPAEDADIAAWLRADPKSRAENLMITDLLRNDLSRVALIGSVRVPDLFTVETYPTVHQMTSTVEARLRPGMGFRDIVERLFPCGSVTGAPKIRAMEIIHELETGSRGAYTGSVGMVAPNGDLRFNVAIRTLFVGAGGDGEMGIGSGIVHDSDPAAEYEECLLKARFLTAEHEGFQLIETMRWSRGDGFYLLEEHMERLESSARFFGIPCDSSTVRALLALCVRGMNGKQRVRLLLDQGGRASATATAVTLPDPPPAVSYALATRPVDSRDRHRYHKTTRREVLDEERERLAAETGCDEVLFVNERGELTEGSYTNLFVEKGGWLLTPPLSCGLLDGTLRRELLETGGQVEERVLYPRDLEEADAVWLGNSVRGLRPARAVTPR